MAARENPDSGELELSARRFWEARGLPPASGLLGPASGPLVRQFLGSFAYGDPAVQVAMRVVRADVDARYYLLAGRRVFGTLRRIGPSRGTETPEVERLLAGLGVWTGGTEHRAWDDRDVRGGIQALVERLARRGIIVLRDGPIRLCPRCEAPRSPERTIYQEEVGDTYLVRFPLLGGPAPTDALVWIDAPWRLLGTSALLVNPEITYVVAEYAHDGSTTRLLLAGSAVDRLRAWIPGATVRVVEELKGRELVGRAYGYPLRHEFPEGASLAPPAGTVQAVRDVGDSGTGIVPLVPGHGGTDGEIAERLGIIGWPLLTTRGELDLGLQHKYAGLDLPTANDFVVRDLTDAGSILARLRVLRGVPYCGVCGHTVIWIPGRAWRLDLGALPGELARRYEKLLPLDRPIAQLEVTTWPVSETVTTSDEAAVTLLECSRCDRLEAPGAPENCSCGGLRQPGARRLLPAFAGTLAAWATSGPPVESLTGSPPSLVRLYVGDRRRAPTVVHHLVAWAALDRPPRDLELVVVPTVRSVDLDLLLHQCGADAVRAALVGAGPFEPSGDALAETARQEQRRLTRLVSLAGDLRPDLGGGAERRGDRSVPPPDRDSELEDRALIACWARQEREAIAAYEAGRPSVAYRLATRFVDEDLERYRELVRSRTGAATPPSSRRAVVATLRLILRGVAEAIGPIAPHAAEAIHRELDGGDRSLFETGSWTDRELSLNEDLVLRWGEWTSFFRAVSRFRRERHVPTETELPLAAVVFDDEALAERFRADLPLLGRLARISRLEVGSPTRPWAGKLRRVVPVEREVARSYPAIAPQVVQLIRRLPPRGPTDRDPLRGISVVVNGLVRPIAPDLLRVSDELPSGVVRAPCSLGELFVGLPATTAGERPALPPVSTDAGWLVRQVGRRLRAGSGAHFDPRQAPLAVVHADGPLASELEQFAAPLATYLGLRELRVVTSEPDLSIPNRVRGRTRTGARWQVELPETPLPATSAPRRSHPTRRGRVPPAAPEVPGPGDDLDYGSATYLAREAGIRALEVDLLQTLEGAILGPTKVGYAWDAGLRSVSDVLSAPYETLAALPGFGRPVALELLFAGGRELPLAEPPSSNGNVEATLTQPRDRASPPTVPHAPEDSESVPDGRARFRQPPPRTTGPGRSSPPPTVVSATSTAPGVAGPGMTETPVRRPELEDPTSTVVPPPGERHPPLAPPVEATPLQPGKEPPFPAARSAIILGTDPWPEATSPFADAVRGGSPGVALVREAPEALERGLTGLRATVLWLTNLPRPNTVRPDDLDGVGRRLGTEIREAGVRAVYLDGVEYLIQLHGFPRVLALLRTVEAAAAAADATVWVHVDPDLVTASELEALRAELGRVGKGA